jgi:1-acyl-sn-glycerol-3-phosphate acyltransferase
MHILKPIYYDEYKDMKNTELCEYVRKKIEEKISIILK